MNARRLFFSFFMLGLAATAEAQTPLPPSFPVPSASPRVSAPFDVLDNVEGDYVNFNPVAVRPMAFVSASGPHLYAVNTYLNVVQHIDSSQQIVDTFRTLSGPVAIARYVAPSGPNPDRLLVVCQSSDAMVVHDRLTGAVLDVVYLPSQPADVVVDDAAGRAFVSSIGEDVVVEIDLVAPTAPHVFYRIPSRKPTFLSKGPGGEILVAPMLSGNNSVVEYLDDTIPFTTNTVNPHADERGILDLDDPAIASVGLPDEDLFLIDRAAGVARPLVRGTGTVLTAHQVVATATGLWLYQLNVEMNNKDPDRQNRPAIQGEIAFNRLTRMPISFGPGVPPKPSSAHFVNLDDTDPSAPGIQYDRDGSVGHPYALHVLSSGEALVAGVLSDNIVRLDVNGQRIDEWDLPDGCIPRQILAHPSEQVVYTYCSGTNTIDVDRIAPTRSDFGTYSVGYDPTPEKVRRGRELFYDGAFSRHNNASCATCHVEGGIDLVPWNLSVPVFDEKGPMITQSLFASNRTGTPYWRAAQRNGLIDFNGAFPDLMGGTSMSDAEFADFQAFVHSLEPAPNPHESVFRRLDDDIQIPDELSAYGLIDPGSAIGGQANFGFCNNCHVLPTGGIDDTSDTGVDFDEVRPKRQHMKVATLLTLPERGLQPLVTVQLAGGTSRTYPLLGTAMAHAGNPDNIADFLLVFRKNGFSEATLVDWMNFLFQLDNGVAPSTRIPVRLDASTAANATPIISGFLEAQASAGHCDVAVFGRTFSSGAPRDAGWIYDPTTDDYLGDDGVRRPRSFFLGRTEAGEDFVFVGVPVGTGRQFAVDFDDDDLLNGLEPSGGLYDSDTDDDGWLDGHEVANGGDALDPMVGPNDTTPPQIQWTSPVPLWRNARNGRLNFSTHELTRWNLILEPPTGSGLPTKHFSEEDPGRHHSVLVRGLHPSTAYVAQLLVFDLGGNAAPISTSFVFETTDPLLDNAHQDQSAVVIGGVRWSSVADGPGQGTFTVDVRLVDRIDQTDPRSGRVVVARPVVDGVPAGTAGGPGLVTPGRAQDFCVNGTPYSTVAGAVPGPFAISGPSGSGGWARLEFTLTGISSGDRIDLSFEAVSTHDGATCGGPAPQPIDLDNPAGDFPVGWSFPDTPAALRSSTHVF